MKNGKDFKDSFETLVIVMFSIFFVSVMNEKCSSASKKLTDTKIEKMQIEKKQIMDSQKVR